MKERFILAAILFFVTLYVYLPVKDYAFIRYDDELFVTKNSFLPRGFTGENLWHIVTTRETGNWHPLTWLSFLLDFKLFRFYAGGYHLVNLFFHLLSTLLIFFLLLQTTKLTYPSFAVAALFSLHPLHVEPVAWIAGRKDVLCAFFFFLTFLFYREYVRKRNFSSYLTVFFFFLLALMAKPVAISLPLLLLLFDFWPLQRQEGWAKLIREKIPLFLLSFLIGVVTLIAQREAGALVSLSSLPISSRFVHMTEAYFSYLIKTFYPQHLAVFYPLKQNRNLVEGLFLSLLGLFITLLCYRWKEKRPYLLTGWLWYVVSLFAVSGFIQVGSQAMADRYTYIPLVGIFLMFCFGIFEVLPARRKVLSFVLLTFPLFIFLAVLSRQQLSYWRTSETLFRHALNVTEKNYLAHNNLGALLLDRGEIDAASHHFHQALLIRPNYAVSYNNLGNVAVLRGQREEAERYYRKALQLMPNYGQARRNLADLLLRSGKPQEAIVLYREILRVSPWDAEVENNLGVALYLVGDPTGAREHFLKALDLRPDYEAPKENLKKIEKVHVIY